MRVSLSVLRSFGAPLPTELRATRHLFDDLGLEVKRVEDTSFLLEQTATGEKQCFEDATLVLELLANRGDHRCYLGLAREFCGRAGTIPNTPPVTTLQHRPWAEDPDDACGVPVRIETPLCLRYALTPFEIVGAGVLEASEVLTKSGQQSIHPVVDATNIASLELGQPTHAFDADTLVGGVTIRLSREGERALPLFQDEPITLPEGIIVIADDVKVLAIAGVIGCQESRVTDATRRVLLESACFDPVSVRKAGRKLNIHTDACARFERGSDPEAVLAAAGRVVWLLESAGLVARTGPTSVVGSWVDPNRCIPLSLARLSQFLHVNVRAEDVARCFAGLGFVVYGEGDALSVAVPSWRLWDVVNPEDIYEEYARMAGFDALPATLAPAALGAVLTPAQQVRATLSDVLLGYGFYEVISNGFYGHRLREAMGIDRSHPLWPHIETLNSVDRDYSLLKNNGLAQALEGLSDNQRFGVERARTFEFTRTFHPDAQGYCAERPLMWALASGPEREPGWAHRPVATDLYHLRGVIEEIGVALGLPITFGPLPDDAPLATCLHPHRCFGLRIGEQPVGLVGEVHPGLVQRFDLRRCRPVYLELDLQALTDSAASLPAVVLPSVRPPSVRSLAFALPDRVEAGLIVDLLRARAGAELERVDITDLFVLDDGRRAITYVVAWRNDEGALSAAEINARVETLASAVESQLEGVRRRV